MNENVFAHYDFTKHFTTWGDRSWQDMCRVERKVEAIKEVRAVYGYGLKEAKDLVEAWWEWEKRKRLEEPMYIQKHFEDTYRIIQHKDGSFTIMKETKLKNAGELVEFFVKLGWGPRA